MTFRARWLLLLALPALGVVELGLHLYFASRAPRVSEWAELVPAVDQLRRAGDLIVVAPRWAEPLARSVLGDARLPVQDAARADETSYPRAVEIGVLGATSPELDGWPVLGERRAGRFRFRVLQNPDFVKPSFVFTDELEAPRAAVFDELDGARTPCRFNTHARVSAGTLPGPPAFPAVRFECRGGGPHFAGVTIIDDQDYRPRRCLWAQPPARGARVIEFSGVPLGGSIQGYAGSPWLMMRDSQAAPVRVEVSVDGRSIGHFEHLDREGWKHFTLPTGAAGSMATVRFEITSPGAQGRQLCFHADTR